MSPCLGPLPYYLQDIRYHLGGSPVIYPSLTSMPCLFPLIYCEFLKSRDDLLFTLGYGTSLET